MRTRSQDAAEEQMRRDCVKSLAAFVQQSWHVFEPSTPLIGNWHIDVVCEHVQALLEDRLIRDGRVIRNLIINVPPGSLKSTILSVCLPAWMWINNPSWRGLFASGNESIALRDSMKCRYILDSDWYKRLFRPEWQFASDQNAKGHYVNTKRGFRHAISAGSRITGSRADCVAGSTMVATEIGNVRIEELVRFPVIPKVASFNHSTGKVEYSEVIATREIGKRKVLTIRTLSGNILVCTPNHRVWNGSTYGPAANLTGNHLSVLRGAVNDMARESNPLPEVRSGHADMCYLPEGIQAERGRTRQVDQKRNGLRPVLLSGVCQLQSASTGTGLRNLRQDIQTRDAEREPEILLNRVFSIGEAGKLPVEAERLRVVQEGIPTGHNHGAVLFNGLQKCQPFKACPGPFEPTVQGRQRTGRALLADEAVDSGTGQWSMCAVPERQAGACPSHRCECGKQCPGELGLPLPVMSFDIPYVESPENERVEDVRDCQREIDVYDIQVEGNHNFFANGILVHNCVMVDDPNDAAAGKADRDAIISWWDDAAYNRLNDLNTGHRCIIQQRLHEEDLTGHILATDAQDWEHLVIRQEFELGDEQPWDPRTTEGELFFPARFPAEVVAAEKRIKGSAGYAGQHQQRPTAKEGEIFKRGYVKFFKGVPRFTRTLLSADTAFKEKEESDYSVILAAGVCEEEGHAGIYLLDRWKEQAGYPVLKTKARTMGDRWHPEVFLIEDKASGQSLIQELTNDTLLPVRAVKADTDKVSRANTCTPTWEASIIYLPEGAEWVDDFLENLYGFPKKAHDDDVDAFTQLVRYIVLGMTAQGFLGWLAGKQKEEPCASSPTKQPFLIQL